LVGLVGRQSVLWRIAGFIFVCFAYFAVNQFPVSNDYQLVQLANGANTLFSASYGEKLHPGLGPQAEADLLYVRQLKICERLRNHAGELIIWDIGLGAAANALAALRATREISGRLRLVSFDNTSEPLAFALKNSAALGYLADYENQITGLLRDRCVEFDNGKLSVIWEFHLGDFPALVVSGILPAVEPGILPGGLSRETFTGLNHSEANPGGKMPPSTAGRMPAATPPHAIFYDAFSPAKNPAMWTLPVFENLFRALDPAQPCALTTYSRSTLIRATLLLAGFFVGVGHATGMKEETTIAANTPALITEPLHARWLERALRSDSAEPLREPVYSRAPLTPATAGKLRRHPQFCKVSEKSVD
jgi:tRNA U34 5-methylaminomethyl-2-thiouridine-forming methyltransferase MnmC